MYRLAIHSVSSSLSGAQTGPRDADKSKARCCKHRAFSFVRHCNEYKLPKGHLFCKSLISQIAFSCILVGKWYAVDIMSIETREFALQRLKALTDELSLISQDLSLNFQRVALISAELEKLNAALLGMLSEPVKTDSIMVNRVQTEQKSTGSYVRNDAKIRRGSIKDYAVQVLSDSPNGMVAMDILAAINERFQKDYDRTSLSPQLSRLRQDGVLGLRGPVWYLKGK